MRAILRTHAGRFFCPHFPSAWIPRLSAWCVWGAVAAWAAQAWALTFVSEPVFTPSTNAPLAGALALMTDVPARVSVSVNNGRESWTRAFNQYNTAHLVPLLGFKPSRTNVIQVSVTDLQGNSLSAPQPLAFVTGPLPADFPTPVVFKSNPAKMEPGYTLFRLHNLSTRAFLTIVDNTGDVVWYSTLPSTADVRQLPNGDLFVPLTTNFVEINLLGETVRSWPVPQGYAINLHDGVPTDHGTILYLSDASEVLTDFPTSATNANAPTQTTAVLHNRVVEISATNASLLHVWSPIDILDPRRLTYLTFAINTPQGLDIQHANAVTEDPKDHNLIVSMRHQNLVFKFSRETGQLLWLLGPPENWGPAFQPYLLTPVGQPFVWNYGQHAPTFTPQGTLLLYDDGNDRAMPFDPPLPPAQNYSRAVEYQIDEQTMQVRQVWDCGRTNADVRLYTDRVGNAEWEPQTGNVLIDFGYVLYVDGAPPSPAAPAAALCRFREVTHTAVPEVVFDEAFFDFNNHLSSYRGDFAYRCHRIPDLYAAQPATCPDLTLVPQTTLLPSGSVGSPYSQSFLAGGAVGSVGFAATAGNVPPGLSLSYEGTLSGLPSVAGTYVFTVAATDSQGCNVSQTYTLAVSNSTLALLTVQSQGPGSVTPDVNGQFLTIGSNYTLTASPEPGYAFAGWTGSIVSRTPTLSFTLESNLVLQANFVLAQFIPSRSTFQGLVYDTNGIAPESSGLFTLRTTPQRHFSGSLRLGGKRYGFSGLFDVQGAAQATLHGSGSHRLTVNLQMNLDPASGQIGGSVSNGLWVAALAGDRALYNAHNLAPQAGRYSLLIPGSQSGTNAPFGDGYGHVLVSKAGHVHLAAALADGTKVSQGTTVSAAGQWPLYEPLYGRQGLLLGWLTFAHDAAEGLDLTGPLSWLKPSGHSKYYASGFGVEPLAVGARWPASARSQALWFTNGTLVLSGGNLSQSLTNEFRMKGRNKVMDLSGRHLRLVFSAASGAFHGSVQDPVTRKRIPFAGMVLQQPNSASGFFLGTDQSGQALLQPK